MIHPSPSLQLTGGVSYTNQPLIHAPPNFNAFQNNHTAPFTITPSYAYDDLVRTSQFESTARGISGKIDWLEQGQQAVLNRFGYFDEKVDNMDERSMRNLRDLNDMLRDLGVSR
ncbi:hypothetical protein IFR05_008974 [Cadophora sp. M221]|nr:hypothetical protein IFR05_008974 [Cadophora sp. M221]